MDLIGDVIKATTDGVSKCARSASREVSRALGEEVENINKDFDSIATAIDKGGLLGGAIQAVDVFSPGHQAVNHLDAWNILPEDPALQELVAGGINVATPGWSLVALKDVADAMGAIKTSGKHAPLAPSLGADAPRVSTSGPKGYTLEPLHGFDDSGASGGCTGAPGGASERLRDALKRFQHSWKQGLEGPDGDQLEADLRKILSNPNLMFEDMIFLLMRAFIKDTRRQVKGLTEELKTSTEENSKDRRASASEIKGARFALEKAQESKDPKKIAAAQNKLADLQDKRETTQAEKTEARADKFEELKQIMQRLSEMEQALSNVLNTMHEGAMSAIRNIR